MASSTAPMVYDRLEFLLINHADLQDVEVTVGFSKDKPSRWILLGEIRWAEETFAAIGGKRRQEEYDIRFYINVTKRGGQNREVMDDLLAILATVEDVMRDNINIIPEVIDAQIKPESLSAYAVPGGAECQFEGAISVRARK